MSEKTVHLPFRGSLALLSILLLSCQSTIQVDEFCNIKSPIDGEYITYSEVLYLAKDNDTLNMELDTMYFKVSKITDHRFKLENWEEYESLQNSQHLEREKYVYLKPSNDHEKAWRSTLIQHHTPKYTDWIKCICTEDIRPDLLNLVQTQLTKAGYPIRPSSTHELEGELKEVLIRYQKDQQLPYGSLNLLTLNRLGIRVKEK